MKKTQIKKDSINAVIKQAEDIVAKKMLCNDKKGWRNKLTTKQEDPGATATALGLWFCRETRSKIYVECSANGGTNKRKISSYYEELIETILSMQLTDESGEKKLGWALHEHPNISSVDATATVIKALNHWSLTHIKPEIIPSLQFAAEWLLEQNEVITGSGGNRKYGGWGINKHDSDRVFVTCNALQAILLLNLKLDEIENAEIKIKDATNWLMEVKSENVDANGAKLWSWGKKKIEPSHDDTPTLYHTAKVLNYLSIYIDWSADDNNNVKEAYENGINYIRTQIMDGSFNTRNDFIVNEICQPARYERDNDKQYEHDGFAELMELMMDPRGKWKLHEKCEVLDSFLGIIRDCSKNGLEYWEKITEDSNESRMWLLVPMAKVLYDLRECGLPHFNKLLIVSPKIALIDPSRMTKIWFGGYNAFKLIRKHLIRAVLIAFIVFAIVVFIVGYIKSSVIVSIIGATVSIVAGVLTIIHKIVSFSKGRKK